MTSVGLVAGVDVGSTYTKCVLTREDGAVVAKAMRRTGFRLPEVSRAVVDDALESVGATRRELLYVMAAGMGRHQVGDKDLYVTELTAAARGAIALHPGTRTVLDIGGQTMKATRLDPRGRISNFRLNDKCAAGTGAFLEKTAAYMGYSTEEIGGLLATARGSVPISGVCAVFAESEVINHLSLGTAPADIMLGAVDSLVARSVQLLKRVGGESELTLVGGILRFERMSAAVVEKLSLLSRGIRVNVLPGDGAQLATAHGASLLGWQRLARRDASVAGSVHA
jgi:predicted CoA-substrate-specific enzyme activase